MLKKGDIVDCRYLIDSAVGYGGTSRVFKALDLKADNAFRAVKEVTGNIGDMCSKLTESSLMSELYQSNAKLNFVPNILRRLKNENSLYIVMEYIEGINMGTLLQNQSLSYRKLIEYAKDMCTFITFMHQKNKLYCDMKPDNIMIIKNDISSEKIKSSKRFNSLKFIDFSLVINKGEPSSGFTPEYAAPEQYMCRFSEVIPDERTDVFNIGATLYHMFTGKLPMPVYSDNGIDSGEVRPSTERFVFTSQDPANAGLRRIILKCVNDDPKQRYKSCHKIYKELVNLSEHNHVKLSALLAAAALLCSFGGTISSREYKIQSKNQFKYFMDIAKKSSSPKEKIDNYSKAIEIEPGNLDAYIQLIDACSYSKYENDSSETLFTAEEKSRILHIIHQNKQLLISEKNYEKVSFELGKLIWYHEDYGLSENSDNKTTRMRDAVPYFEDAILTENGDTLSKENREMARTYYNIGKFYSDIITNKSENNNELYINFWNDLHDMMDFVIDSNSKNDLVRLETFRTTLDALDSYSSYFRECGYTYEQQIEFFEYIRTNADKCDPDVNTKEIYNLKQEIQDRYDQCMQSIEMTFSSNRNEVTE